MAVTFTSTDLTNLKAALVTGATEVQIGDRRVKYRSQKELLEAIRIVEQYLSGVSTDQDDNPNIVQATFSKGSE